MYRRPRPLGPRWSVCRVTHSDTSYGRAAVAPVPTTPETPLMGAHSVSSACSRLPPPPSLSVPSVCVSITTPTSVNFTSDGYWLLNAAPPVPNVVLFHTLCHLLASETARAWHWVGVRSGSDPGKPQ